MENKSAVVSTELNNQISCEVYTSFKPLEGMQEQWDQFIESMGSEIFLTYDWCRIWWKYYGKNRDLKIFIFRSNDEIVGLIPLFFEKIWLGPIFVQVGKIIGSDFNLYQLSPPLNPTYINEVVRSFHESISKYKWDIIYLGPIAGMYEHFEHLVANSKKYFGKSCRVLSEEKGVQTYFHLQNNWEDYISSLGRKERRNIRSHYRLISKLLGNDTYQIESDFVTEDHFDEVFDEFVLMHRHHWNKLGKGGHFNDWPNSIEFHRELTKIQSRRGRLRFLRCSIKNRCLGYEYYYRFGNKYVGMVTAHSDLPEPRYISLGKITFSELVKKILNEKIFCVDSMRGRYEYKQDLGGKLYPIRNLYIIRNKLYSKVRVTIFHFLSWCLNLCYYRIWFSRIAPKLPFKRRGLWRIWIRSRSFA